MALRRPAAGSNGTGVRVMDTASFGDAFLAAAVTRERVLSVVTQLVGESVRFGPISVGPAGIARATAEGRPSTIEVRSLDGDGHGFVVHFGLDLQVEVRVRGQRLRYPVRLSVPLRLAVQPVTPVSIRIVAETVRSDEICVEVCAEARTTRLLGMVGNLEGQLRRHAGVCIEQILETPAGQRLRTIDVVAVIDRAWDAGLVWAAP